MVQNTPFRAIFDNNLNVRAYMKKLVKSFSVEYRIIFNLNDH